MDNIGRTVASSVILATNLKGEIFYRPSEQSPPFPQPLTISYGSYVPPLAAQVPLVDAKEAWQSEVAPRLTPTVSDQEQQIIAMVDEYLEKCVEQVWEKATKVFFKGLFFFAIFAFVFIVGRWSVGL